jgi:hypothetical protein
MLYRAKRSIDYSMIDNNYLMHQSKLLNAKPAVKSIRTYNIERPFSGKTKKDQLVEDRFTEIERANRILLEKMSNIFNERHFVKPPMFMRKSVATKAKREGLQKIISENNVCL